MLFSVGYNILKPFLAEEYKVELENPILLKFLKVLGSGISWVK